MQELDFNSLLAKATEKVALATPFDTESSSKAYVVIIEHKVAFALRLKNSKYYCLPMAAYDPSKTCSWKAWDKLTEKEVISLYELICSKYFMTDFMSDTVETDWSTKVEDIFGETDVWLFTDFGIVVDIHKVKPLMVFNSLMPALVSAWFRNQIYEAPNGDKITVQEMDI